MYSSAKTQSDAFNPTAYAYVSVNSAGSPQPPPPSSPAYAPRGVLYAVGTPATTTEALAESNRPTPEAIRAYCLAAAVFLAFVVVYICCAVLIPWPDPYGTSADLKINSQEIIYANGRFFESTVVLSNRLGPQLIEFDHAPTLNARRNFALDFSFAPNADAFYREEHADLKQGSDVQISWTYTGGCTLWFQVLRGSAKASAYFNGQPVDADLRVAFYSSSSPIPFVAAGDDTYYFVVSNEDTSCTPTRNGQAEIEISAVAYDLTTAIDTCNLSPASCITYLPYPNDRWFLILTPTSGGDWSIYHYTFGRWWTYTLLYSGLFLGMTCCTGLFCKRARRIQEDTFGLGSEQNPLLRS